MVKGAEATTLGLHGEEIPKDIVTGVGRVLRGTAMDELPQLVNILKGEMNFVGSRAAPAVELNILNEDEKRVKLSIRPGLTGIAQLYESDSTPARQKLRLDKSYTKKKNLYLDMKLMALSLLITLRARWKNTV